jgi:hypothetical protein
MRFDAVTTYAIRHWDRYAKACVETFNKHWIDVALTQFTDDQLESKSGWLSEFKIRNAHRPTDNYRFDSVRFAHKIAAIEIAFNNGTGDALIWMDADCITHAPVDAEWLQGLIGDADFAYLKRARREPETGFMIIRRNEAGADFIAALVELYRSDGLFSMKEWHDAWIIGELVKITNFASVSLSGSADATSHPLVNGPLGEKLDHLKGKRKLTGRSHQSDLKIKRKEAYWNG